MKGADPEARQRSGGAGDSYAEGWGSGPDGGLGMFGGGGVREDDIFGVEFAGTVVPRPPYR